MSVRITDTTNVALYDSTTGHAFGPTFQSADDAQEFLDWLRTKTLVDPRQIPWRELDDLHNAWWKEQEA